MTDLKISTTNRYKLLILLGGKCRICKEDKPQHLEIDHIYDDGADERTKYGSSEKIWGYYLNDELLAYQRLQPLCKQCHSTKHMVRKTSNNDTTVSDAVINPTQLNLMKLTYEIIKQHEGTENPPIHEDVIIQSLIQTNMFTPDAAQQQIRRMLREASIYESKPEHYNTV